MKTMPYKTPAGFFDEARTKALKGAARVRSRRLTLLGSLCTATLLLALTFALHPLDTSHKNTVRANTFSSTDEEILDIYDYDIFLNNLNL